MTSMLTSAKVNKQLRTAVRAKTAQGRTRCGSSSKLFSRLRPILATFFVLGVATQAQSLQLQASAPDSQVAFTALQQGAPARGWFRQFTAKISFDPTSPGACEFDVVIDLASVDTRDGERDELLKSDEMFDVARFPQAHYQSKGCTAQGAGFVSQGKLTLRDITRAVPINFSFDGKTLKGGTQIKRLDFGIGAQGWKETFVANEVQVNFVLLPH